jgi:hypothetical protein
MSPPRTQVADRRHGRSTYRVTAAPRWHSRDFYRRDEAAAFASLVARSDTQGARVTAFEDLTTADAAMDGRIPFTDGRRSSEVRVIDDAGPPHATPPHATPPHATPTREELEFLATTTRSTSLDGVLFVHHRLSEASPGVPAAALLQHFPAETGGWDPTRPQRAPEARELILIEHLEGAAGADPGASDLLGLARGSLDFIGELGLAELDLLGFSLGVRPPEDVVLLPSRLVRRLVAGSRRARGGPRVGPPEPHDD